MSAPHLPTRFAATNPPTDTLGRPLRDLRISVTDRCNFRCPYCMPAELYDQNYRFVARQALLDFDEITRLAKLFVRNGVRKIRLTGGEPLLRRGLPQLIAQLRGIDRELNADRRTAANEPNEAAERQLDLALTTNGSLLATQAETLAEAGLNRITLSLDSLDPATFRRLNGGRASIEPVLEGLQAALKAGLTPIKINCVVQRGVNEDALLPLAALAQKHELSVRFIEYMDVGYLQRLEGRTGVHRPRDARSAPPPLPPRTHTPRLPRRSGTSLPLRRRNTRRDRLHHLDQPTVLRRLPPRTPLLRRTLVHLPLRPRRPRPARLPPQRRKRHHPPHPHRKTLATTTGPLLRTAQRNPPRNK